MSKKEEFVSIVRTIASEKEQSGEAGQVAKIQTKNKKAQHVVDLANVAAKYIPSSMSATVAAQEFTNYIYGMSPVPPIPGWLLESGI